MTARPLALQCLAALALLIAARLILDGDSFGHSWLMLAVLIYLGRRLARRMLPPSGGGRGGPEGAAASRRQSTAGGNC